MLLRDTHCFYDNIKYIDNIDSASDQSPSMKNLEAESKNIVKVTEKTKSKKRKAKYCALIIDLKNLKIMILIIKKIVIIPDERGQEIFNNLSKNMYLK